MVTSPPFATSCFLFLPLKLHPSIHLLFFFSAFALSPLIGFDAARVLILTASLTTSDIALSLLSLPVSLSLSLSLCWGAEELPRLQCRGAAGRRALR